MDDACACLAVLKQIDCANQARELQEAVAAAVGEAGVVAKVEAETGMGEAETAQ